MLASAAWCSTSNSRTTASALLRLVERADVLLESWDPGTLERLGLGAATLRERNPRLIVTSVSGFGQEGPYRDYRCTDLVGLAMGGLLYVSGDPSLPPVKAPETQAYYFASVYAAFGTLLALHRRAADDQGRQVDISVQETIAAQESIVRTHGFEGRASLASAASTRASVRRRSFPRATATSTCSSPAPTGA